VQTRLGQGGFSAPREPAPSPRELAPPARGLRVPRHPRAFPRGLPGDKSGKGKKGISSIKCVLGRPGSAFWSHGPSGSSDSPLFKGDIRLKLSTGVSTPHWAGIMRDTADHEDWSEIVWQCRCRAPPHSRSKPQAEFPCRYPAPGTGLHPRVSCRIDFSSSQLRPRTQVPLLGRIHTLNLRGWVTDVSRGIHEKSPTIHPHDAACQLVSVQPTMASRQCSPHSHGSHRATGPR
jgi:hypothetical protein